MQANELDLVERLNEIRKIKGVTLEELADKCVLSQSYLSRIFNKTNEPKVSTLMRIATALDTKIYIYF